MTPSQIILNDQEAIKFGAQKVLEGAITAVNSGAAIMMQKNNSLLLVIGLGKTAVEIHLYTTDAAMALASAIKYFHQKLVESDVERVYGTEPQNQKIISLMSSVGINVQKSDRPEYQWMANV
jgi:hypothetical protein